MEATDALGNPVILGNRYGYSQQSSGVVTIVIGKVEKINQLKVTLGDVSSRRGVYGKIENSFSLEEGKRSVNACHIFPL